MSELLSKEQKWRAHIEACRASGMSIKGWCNLNQLSADQYYYWNKKLSSTQTSTYKPEVEWASVNMTTQMSPSYQDSPVVVHHQGYAIEIREGFNQDVLLNVLTVIGALC